MTSFYILREYFPRNPDQTYSDVSDENDNVSLFSKMGRDNDDGTFTRVERNHDDDPMAFASQEDANKHLESMKVGRLFPCRQDEVQLQWVWVEQLED